jgi:general stress protein 26
MLEKMSHSDPGDFARLGELIRDIRVALLTTIDRDGRFHTRPVQTLQVEADRTLWFFTDWSAPKVDELHHDARVSLGYADPEKNVYVAVSGSGSLLRDAQKAKQLWSGLIPSHCPALTTITFVWRRLSGNPRNSPVSPTQSADDRWHLCRIIGTTIPI